MAQLGPGLDPLTLSDEEDSVAAYYNCRQYVGAPGGYVAPFKVVIADQPAADHEVESAALAASGLALDTVWLGAREPERVLEHAADADALVMSWVPMTRSLIDQLTRCRV